MKSVELLKEAASDLSMRTSLGVIEAEWDDAFAQIAVNRPLSAHELQRLANYGERVSTVFATEACSLALMTHAPGHAAYAAPERPLFGEQVEEAFPTASAEIARSEEHTSELQSLMSHSYAAICFKNKKYK